MKKELLTKGIAIIPDDWIVLPSENGTHALVVEVRNGHRFRCPHFFIRSDKTAAQLTDEESDEIRAQCKEVSPEFQEAIKHEAVPIINVNDNKQISAWKAGTTFGIFDIPTLEETSYPPYGAYTIYF